MLNEAPTGWSSGPLIEFFQLQRGHDLPVQDRNGGEVPVVASNGAVGYHDQSPLTGPGVITGRSGTIGNVQYADGAYWPLNTTLYVNNFKGSYPRFVYYFLQNFPLKDFQTGTGVPTLNRNDVHVVDVVFPPLPEQRRIAEILGSVDAAIEATKAVIEQTKTVKQGLLQSLLTRGIGHTEFKDSPLGETPEGWAERNLGHVIDFINGYAFKPEDWSTSGTPIIRIQNLNGSNEFNYYEGTVPSKCHVHEGDLLFCWSGSRGTSFGARKWQGPLGFLNQHIFRCVVSNELDQAFAFYLLEGMTRKIESEAHGGGGLVHIKKSELVKFEIGLPPLNEQKQIVEVLASVDHQIALESSKLERLFVLKSGLMDDLLTGNVRVPEAMGLAA